MEKIIDTGITEEMLKENTFPKIKIGNKLYDVNNKKSTFNKIQAVSSNKELKEDEMNEKIFALAFGEDAAKEILELDLPVENFNYLSFCVMGAITGKKKKKLQAEAKKSKN